MNNNFRMNHTFIGVDLHKATHTAVMVNCWGEKIDEITIENKPSEFDALVIKVYNGAHYDVMDAFGDKSLNDAQALEKALEKYRTFGGWSDNGEGWTNRLRNLINLYRHADYTKLY